MLFISEMNARLKIHVLGVFEAMVTSFFKSLLSSEGLFLFRSLRC